MAFCVTRDDEAHQWLFCACIFDIALEMLTIPRALGGTAAHDDENCFGDLI
jgi:hypothetical protein